MHVRTAGQLASSTHRVIYADCMQEFGAVDFDRNVTHRVVVDARNTQVYAAKQLNRSVRTYL